MRKFLFLSAILILAAIFNFIIWSWHTNQIIALFNKDDVVKIKYENIFFTNFLCWNVRGKISNLEIESKDKQAVDVKAKTQKYSMESANSIKIPEVNIESNLFTKMVKINLGRNVRIIRNIERAINDETMPKYSDQWELSSDGDLTIDVKFDTSFFKGNYAKKIIDIDRFHITAKPGIITIHKLYNNGESSGEVANVANVQATNAIQIAKQLDIDYKIEEIKDDLFTIKLALAGGIKAVQQESWSNWERYSYAKIGNNELNLEAVIKCQKSAINNGIQDAFLHNEYIALNLSLLFASANITADIKSKLGTSVGYGNINWHATVSQYRDLVYFVALSLIFMDNAFNSTNLHYLSSMQFDSKDSFEDTFKKVIATYKNDTLIGLDNKIANIINALSIFKKNDDNSLEFQSTDPKIWSQAIKIVGLIFADDGPNIKELKTTDSSKPAAAAFTSNSSAVN